MLTDLDGTHTLVELDLAHRRVLWRRAIDEPYDAPVIERWGLTSDNALHGEYVPIEPDARGDLECQRLGFRVGIRRGRYEGVETRWLRWLDEGGTPLPTTEEAARAAEQRAEAAQQRAEAAQQRAEAERRRADEAERRLRELLEKAR